MRFASPCNWMQWQTGAYANANYVIMHALFVRSCIHSLCSNTFAKILAVMKTLLRTSDSCSFSGRAFYLTVLQFHLWPFNSIRFDRHPLISFRLCATVAPVAHEDTVHAWLASISLSVGCRLRGVRHRTALKKLPSAQCAQRLCK